MPQDAHVGVKQYSLEFAENIYWYSTVNILKLLVQEYIETDVILSFRDC